MAVNRIIGLLLLFLASSVFGANQVPEKCPESMYKWWSFQELMITQYGGNAPLIEHTVYACFSTIDSCAEAQGKLKSYGLFGVTGIGVWKTYSTCVETK